MCLLQFYFNNGQNWLRVFGEKAIQTTPKGRATSQQDSLKPELAPYISV
jgi:hypothetical protein